MDELEVVFCSYCRVQTDPVTAYRGPNYDNDGFLLCEDCVLEVLEEWEDQ